MDLNFFFINALNGVVYGAFLLLTFGIVVATESAKRDGTHFALFSAKLVMLSEYDRFHPLVSVGPYPSTSTAVASTADKVGCFVER